MMAFRAGAFRLFSVSRLRLKLRGLAGVIGRGIIVLLCFSSVLHRDPPNLTRF